MPTLTKYEKVRILGARAHQISLGAPALVNINGLNNAMEIAEKELVEKKIPIIIIRKFPNGQIQKIPLDQFD
jgi:DNA-directed RNA polymerases I, II, and III subunit RPABC2